MTLVRHNSRLLKIAAGGVSEDYDQDADEGDPVWEGDAEANLVEEILTETGLGDLRRIRRRYLDIEAGLADVMPGHVVTWNRDGVASSAEVRDVETDHVVLGFVRLHLEIK